MLDLPVRLALDKKKFGDTDLKMLYLKVTHNSFFQNTLATIKKKQDHSIKANLILVEKFLKTLKVFSE